MRYIDATSPQPVGWRAHVARAAPYARPGPPCVRAEIFPSQNEARDWVEMARGSWRRPKDFAASVVPIWPTDSLTGPLIAE